MSRTVNIVMYHYVRDTANTPFPGIRACDVSTFKDQIDYLMKIGSPIGICDLVQAVNHGGELPPNAFLVSFDDGYSDSYTHVFPILHDRGIRGIFFPVADAIINSKVLDVNRIQFVLAAQPDVSLLLRMIEDWIAERQTADSLPSIHELRQEFNATSHLDSPEVMFFKFILQRGLARTIRGELSSYLFQKFVTKDESAFAEELYLSSQQIVTMTESGQSFGSHGYSHEWFDLLSEEDLKSEIADSLNFLSGCGTPTSDWVMCYPYGCNPFTSVLDRLKRLLPDFGCAMAFTDSPGIAQLDTGDRFYTKRIDTNDLFRHQSW